MPYQYQFVVDNLTEKTDITILKQDKERGVVMMDSTKYTRKCSKLVNMKQFCCLNEYLTRSMEGKIQRSLRNLKSLWLKQEYQR